MLDVVIVDLRSFDTLCIAPNGTEVFPGQEVVVETTTGEVRGTAKIMTPNVSEEEVYTVYTTVWGMQPNRILATLTRHNIEWETDTEVPETH